MNSDAPDMHRLLETYLGRSVPLDGYVMMSDGELQGFRDYVMRLHRLIYGGDYETEMAGALQRAMPEWQNAMPDIRTLQTESAMIQASTKAPEQSSGRSHANYIYHLIDLAKAERHEEVSEYILDLWDPDQKNPENPYGHR